MGGRNNACLELRESCAFYIFCKFHPPSPKAPSQAFRPMSTKCVRAELLCVVAQRAVLLSIFFDATLHYMFDWYWTVGHTVFLGPLAPEMGAANESVLLVQWHPFLVIDGVLYKLLVLLIASMICT